jgi:protein-L-isoaspartate(D-aspartate) O-methyltransferase
MSAGADPATARQAMLETIRREVRWHGAGDGARELDPRVLEALGTVPRERFVAPDLQALAYQNRPLPIGHDQTISQPLVVAMMTHLLRIEPDSRVLEIGTGCGYQTAILAELAREVVTIEIVAPLAERARATLEALGYRNVVFQVGDGAAGWPELAPYDRILVTAAPRAVPAPLLEQLAPGGRMITPIGADPIAQDLALIEKDEAGRLIEQRLFPVAFVPLTGTGPST